MSSQTLTLDKVREDTPAGFRRPVIGEGRETVENLREDTSLPHGQHRLGRAVRPWSVSAEDQIGEELGRAVQIIFDEKPIDRNRTPLRPSLEALGKLRSDGEAADWLEVAAILKRDVARLRLSNYSRHAAVLLAIADALSFTEPDEIPESEKAGPLFSHVLGLLSEPYISEPDEEEFLGQLLIAGWNLAPSGEQVSETVI
jgi:hypothetical protein